MSRKALLVLTLAAFAATAMAAAPAEAATAGKSSARKAAQAASSKARSAKVSRVKATLPARAGLRKPAARAARAGIVRVAYQPEFGADGNPLLRSAAVVVQDESTGRILFEKNPGAVVPIASITKLMTAMVVLDAQLGLAETLSVSDEDVDTLKGSSSRLPVGSQLSREDMLRLALMASENRAASALSRHYPGGKAAFVAAMNLKAQSLGLTDTLFHDPTGLDANNVSSGRDLARMVSAAAKYPLIREFSTSPEYTVLLKGRPRGFHNTNALVRSPDWEIGVSKTGYISEAGKCLVMQAWFNNKPTIIVLLDSSGRLTRIGDANRIKRWIETVSAMNRQV